MDTQEFTLHDGVVSVKVKGDGNRITLDFDTTDTEHGKPVVSMQKFEHATIVSDKIRAAWAVITGKEMPEATLGKLDSHLHLDATFEPAQTLDALAVVRGAVKAQEPVKRAPLPPKPPATPDDFSPLATAPVEIVPEPSASQSLLARLKSAEADAYSKQSIRRWILENQIDGITASVYPIGESVLTGISREGVADDKKLVAVRITPGKNTADARTEITRLTNEVEKLLMARGLDIRLANVHLGTEADGRRDSGVILVDAGEDPIKTIGAANSVLEHVQNHLDILKAKLGRGRGEDYRQRRDIPAEPGAAELALLAHIREAERSGLLKVTGDDAELRRWVKITADRMKDHMRDQDTPPDQARSA